MLSMPITASIDTTRTIEPSNGDEKFTVYQISVRGGVNHTIDRRYREFEALHTRLATSISVPQFPRKVLLHRRSLKLIEQRRQLLEVYLNEILKRCQQQQSIIPDELARFLQLPPYDSDSQANEKAHHDEQNTLNNEMKYALEHAPSICIADRWPWNSDHREILVDSVLTGIMHSMYDM